jgi:repressor LexA
LAQKDIMAVGHRIRELRIAAKLTLEQLAERVSAADPLAPPVHFTTIAKIEKSQRTISLDWIVKLARALGVNTGALVSNDVQAIRMIPLIGSIAAGGYQEAVQDPEEMIPVPADTGINAFALRPNGDSMNMVAHDGSIVVIDPDQPDLLDGKLYAIMNSQGETTFKRFRADPPRLEPMSTNPDHKPIPLGREPFTVIGRVVMNIVRL